MCESGEILDDIPKLSSLKKVEDVSIWAYLERHGKCWSDTRFANANIGIDEGVQDGGLWGLDDLIESVRKHDTACERIRERDGVTIKSKSIVLKNNLPKRKPATINELIIPSLQSTHAFTLKRETGKVCFSFFFKKKVV